MNRRERGTKFFFSMNSVDANPIFYDYTHENVEWMGPNEVYSVRVQLNFITFFDDLLISLHEELER